MRYAVEDGADPPVRLSLEIRGEGSQAVIRGMMPDGHTFTVLSLNAAGRLVRYTGLPADSGFDLTEINEIGVGRMIVEESQENQSPADTSPVYTFARTAVQEMTDLMAGATAPPMEDPHPMDVDEDEI